MEADDAALRELVMRFESLGGVWEGCEFGMFQVACGAKPLGLLAYARMDTAQLLDAMRSRFAGVGTPAQTMLTVSESGEYMITDRRFGLFTHTFQQAGAADHDSLLRTSCVRLQRLREKLLEDLELGEKIFVFKNSDRNLFDDELQALYWAFQDCGPGTLLYVRLADADHPFPTVQWRAPGLLVGYIDRFAMDADRAGKPDGAGNVIRPHESWAAICRAADSVNRSTPWMAFARPEPPARPSWLDLLRQAEQGVAGLRGSTLVHVANIGDVVAESGLIGGERGRGRGIEGMSLTLSGLPRGELQYRALLRSQAWTEWANGGGFIGSRGRSEPLLGLEVRLRGAAAARLTCACAATFVGETPVVVAADGLGCRSPSGAALESFVIALHEPSAATATAAIPDVAYP